jgi:hypothetical protein
MPCPHDWTEGAATLTLATSVASGLIRNSVPADRRRPKVPFSELEDGEALAEAAAGADGLER